jgi:divinyl protochlorophyllide a 8-vinyl-reductase
MSEVKENLSESKIGPNSIIQTAESLREHCGIEVKTKVLQDAGLDQYNTELPSDMTTETHFHWFVKSLLSDQGKEMAAEILQDSGERTAVYLLKNRIPGFFQTIVKPLPNKLGLKMLLFAISKNAWTFAGSGEFSYNIGEASYIKVIVTHPSEPVVSNFYFGTFKRLLGELISANIRLELETLEAGECIECTYHIQNL